jgi:predicted ATPase
VDEAFAGNAQLALVSGEPGIGKTRLAEELSRRAESRGFLVGWGRSWEGEGTPAYVPWRQALRRLASFPKLKSVFYDADAAVSGLIDRARSTTATTTTDRDPTEARFRMFDALAELLRDASAIEPILIVLDDLHAADVSVEATWCRPRE